VSDSYRYDVTVSFAGEDRPTVEDLVRLLRRNGVRVFYDAWEQADLWGKDLYQHLDSIYRTAARYCVIFVSEHYVKKAWTKHELKSAQARAFAENVEYILPVRLDDTQLPGLPPTVAYLDARNTSLSAICQLLLLKLDLKPTIDVAELLKSDDDKDRSMALSRIGILGYADYTDRVIELMLTDPSDSVREAAAHALDNLNDVRALPALIQAIHDRSWGVRSSAGWALVHLGEVVVSEVENVLRISENKDAKEMASLILLNL
jgi:hypothetical protein